MFNKKDVEKEYKENLKEAESLLENKEKTEELLIDLENKLKLIPKLGKEFSYVPTMISLIRSYIKKEYKTIPVGSILAILSALIYILNPFDIVPDSIPVLGLIDDAFVIKLCLKLVKSDLEDYKKWRNKRRRKN